MSLSMVLDCVFPEGAKQALYISEDARVSFRLAMGGVIRTVVNFTIVVPAHPSSCKEGNVLVMIQSQNALPRILTPSPTNYTGTTP